MAGYLARRLLQSAGVLWAAFTLSFLILYLLPSDPISMMVDGVAEAGTLDPAATAQLKARYGLDLPVWQQYLQSLRGAVGGDLGLSITTGRPVTGLIGTALPSTLALAGAALGLALLAGAGLAVATAWTRSRRLKAFLRALPPVSTALPTFWVGLVLVQIFSFGLRLLPAFGDSAPVHVILPALTLALPTGAVIAQVLGDALESTLHRPFIATARAKGVSRRRILGHHAFRPAAVNALTVAGVIVGNLLAGSVVVETVFARNGVGRLTQQAVLTQDIPVVQGVVMLCATVFVVINLAVDLAYPLLDPRISAASGPAASGPGRPADPAAVAAPATTPRDEELVHA